MNHYQAEVFLSTEKLWKNPETGAFEGTDPDTHEEHGIVEIVKAPTLGLLKAKLQNRFFDFEKPIGADVQIFEGLLEIVCESDTHKDEIDHYSIVIFKVELTPIDLSNEPLFEGVAR